VTKQVAQGTGETYDNADTAVEKQYTYYYHAYHLGRTSVVTEHNGEVYERLEYTPYGGTWLDETSGNSYFDTPYRFSAKKTYRLLNLKSDDQTDLRLLSSCRDTGG
jgi:uncharacterized protein RhaS with RHS repeats